MQDWEQVELEEKIGQGAILLKKLLETPEDCELRDVCEGYINEHAAYLPEERGYDVAKLDERKLNF